jgi:cellulose biosynthesis protein BcsQ
LDTFQTDEDVRKAVLSSIVNVDSLNFCYGDGKLDLLPNSIDMAGSVEPLLFKPNSANYLDMLLVHIKDEYDFIFIDTAPSLDILWRQAVIASDVLIIASKMEEDSVDGLIGVCRETYKLNTSYRDRKKRNIEILGVVVVDYQQNTNFSKHQEPELQAIMENDLTYNIEPGIVFEPKISKTVKAAEIQHKRRIGLLDEPTNNITDEFLQLTANVVYNIFRTRGA